MIQDHVVTPVMDKWNSLFGKDGSILKLITDAGPSVIAGLSSWFAGLESAITGPFKDAIRWIGQTLKNLSGVPGFGAQLGAAGDTLIGIAGKATGGQVTGPHLVGEWGPELFMPSSGGSIMSARQTREMMGGGSGGRTNNFHGNITVMANDPDRLYELLRRETDRRVGV